MITNSNCGATVTVCEPMVSVVVPCRNEKNYIATCLQTILRQEAIPGGLEVIVADGMSDDGTRSVLRKIAQRDARVRIIDNPGLIVSTGLNAAIRSAKGSVIIRMDAHTNYASDYVRRCLDVLQATGADNVGGPWVASGSGNIGKAIAAAFASPFGCGSSRGHNPDYEGIVDTVYLGCWPRQVFERVGLFDEELARNQDDEFNLRLTRAGGKVWQSPRIRSWYLPRSSLFALFKQYKQYGYWKIRVIRKHKVPASVRHLVPGAFVFALVVLLLTAAMWPLAGVAGIGLVSLYLACNLMASFAVAARDGWKLLPFLPLVFACYHLGYGYGSLRGVWDFIVLRREGHSTYKTLSRDSTSSLSQAPLQGEERLG